MNRKSGGGEAAILRSRADQEREQTRRHIQGGVAVVAVLLVLAFLVGDGGEPARRGPERLPPAPKRLRITVSPPGLRAVSVILTDPDGVQQVVEPGRLTELELAGEIQYTAQAPGFRAKHGRFEVPYGPDSGIFELEIRLDPSRTASRRPTTFGRISVGGAR